MRPHTRLQRWHLRSVRDTCRAPAGRLLIRRMVWRQAPTPSYGLDSDRSGRPLGVDLSQATLLFLVLAPGAAFGSMALLWLLGWAAPERVVSRITGVVFSASLFALAYILWHLGSTRAPSVR